MLKNGYQHVASHAYYWNRCQWDGQASVWGLETNNNNSAIKCELVFYLNSLALGRPSVALAYLHISSRSKMCTHILPLIISTCICVCLICLIPFIRVNAWSCMKTWFWCDYENLEIHVMKIPWKLWYEDHYNSWEIHGKSTENFRGYSKWFSYKFHCIFQQITSMNFPRNVKNP